MSDFSVGMQLLFIVVGALLIIGVPCSLLYFNADRLAAWFYRLYMKNQKKKGDKRK